MGLSAYPVLIPFITLSPFPRDTTGPPIPPFYTEHSRIFQVKGPPMRKGSEIGAGLQRCRVWRQDNKAPVIHCQVCFSQFLQHYELHPPPKVRVHGNESTLRSDSVQKAQMKPVGWVVFFFFFRAHPPSTPFGMSPTHCGVPSYLRHIDKLGVTKHGPLGIGKPKGLHDTVIRQCLLFWGCHALRREVESWMVPKHILVGNWGSRGSTCL